MVPPGLIYLAKAIPQILVPTLFAYAFFIILDDLLDFIVYKWIRIATYLLAFPLALTIKIQYRDFVNERAARRYNAVLATRLGDPTPGGLRTLFQIATAGTRAAYPGDGVQKMLVKLGVNTLNTRMLFEDRIFTTEPEHIKSVLATDFDEFEKGKNFRDSVYNLLGTGVFASDGKMWKFHRSMTRPFFNKDRISHFENFDRHADATLKLMKARFQEGFPVDVQDAIARFTLDSATEFLFGHDVQSLASALPYPYYKSSPSSDSESHIPSSQADTFTRAFGQAQMLTAFRSRFGEHWPLAEFWKNKTDEQMDVVKEFLNPILAEAINKKHEKIAAGELIITDETKGREVQEGETLLDHLVNYTDDKNILLDEIMNISVAGRDTTATTLSFIVYMLSQNPDVLARLRAEILSKIGPSRRPEYEDFRDMKYLRAVINETLRLYPPVPFNIRASKNGIVWPATTANGKGIYVPPGVRILYSVLFMQRREDLWGPDAQEFDPDRFLDHRVHKYQTANPYIFLPFNAGPRICLGQQFAYNEVSFFLVRLLQNFSEIALNVDAYPPHFRPPASWKDEPGRKAKEKVMLGTHLTMYIHGGMWVTMKEAEAV